MQKEQKKETLKGGKPKGGKGGKPQAERKLTEPEKTAQAKVEQIEKQIDETQKKIRENMYQTREKENTRYNLNMKIRTNRDALGKIMTQLKEKQEALKETYGKVTQYMDAIRKRKHRRADEREELVKLLPRGAQLPPLKESEEASGVSDYDRAIKLVEEEIERIENTHRTSTFTSEQERKMMGAEARWRSVIVQIKELERKAAEPLADLAEVDVLALLETCRKLKAEIAELEASCAPHYNEIAEAFKKLEENHAPVPKLIEERNALLAQAKDLVVKLHQAQLELNKVGFKAYRERQQKRMEDARKESETIKTRLEEAKKRREALIERSMNSLPHDREVVSANALLSYLRSIALPGTCGVTESAAPKPKTSAPQKPTLTSAPSVELEEASFGATEMVVSRKTQPVPKVAKKKQNKKKKAAAPAEPVTEPKKKTLEDHVSVSPAQLNHFEVLSLSVPETYGEVESCYNEVKEKLEGYEKIRAKVKEEREKSLQEAEKKAAEEEAKKK